MPDTVNEPIRVCQVVNNFDVGGLEKVVLSLLDAIDPKAFELSVICLKGPGKLYDRVHVPKERALVLQSDKPVSLGLARLDLGSIRAIRRFLLEQRVDVVHTHNFAPLIYAGAAAHTRLHRPRVVYSEHNQVNSASKRDLWKFRGYARLADEVVAVSSDLASILRDRLGVTRPIHVIKNGIDARPFRSPSGARVRKELGFGADTFVFGTACVLSKQKGITHLIEAAKRVVPTLPDVRFVVAGDGPLRAELESEARASGLGDRMRFVGYRSDIPDVLDSFDAYVLPSLWEGLPLALLEALCLGKPIVFDERRR